MIIPEIKLDAQEMCDAVGEYLSKHGITVPVESVERSYTGRCAWCVSLKELESLPEVKQ